MAGRGEGGYTQVPRLVEEQEQARVLQVFSFRGLVFGEPALGLGQHGFRGEDIVHARVIVGTGQGSARRPYQVIQK